MPVGKPEGVACRQYGDWLKVDWSYVPVAGDTLAGFKVKWGDGSLPVPWTVPPAIDSGMQGGDGGSPRQYFSLLVRISDGLIANWETFETYPVGAVGVMADGGSMWDGPWNTVEATVGFIGWGDDFESYPLGEVLTPLNKGDGFSGAWAFVVI